MEQLQQKLQECSTQLDLVRLGAKLCTVLVPYSSQPEEAKNLLKLSQKWLQAPNPTQADLCTSAGRKISTKYVPHVSDPDYRVHAVNSILEKLGEAISSAQIAININTPNCKDGNFARSQLDWMVNVFGLLLKYKHIPSDLSQSVLQQLKPEPLQTLDL